LSTSKTLRILFDISLIHMNCWNQPNKSTRAIDFVIGLVSNEMKATHKTIHIKFNFIVFILYRIRHFPKFVFHSHNKVFIQYVLDWIEFDFFRFCSIPTWRQSPN
jgi:hypothetical protein